MKPARRRTKVLRRLVAISGFSGLLASALVVTAEPAERPVGAVVLPPALVAPQASETNPTALAALTARLAATNGLRGKFTQTLTDVYGRTMEVSTGRLLLQKPQLRWETLQPFPQVIAVDEVWVRIYDPDLEQLTQRRVSADQSEVPLTLLTQKAVALDGVFAVSLIPPPGEDVENGADGGREERTPMAENGQLTENYVLLPRSEAALFERIEVRFIAHLLHSIRIYDHLGQQTRIDLSELESGIDIQDVAFELQLPADTEIVEG